MRLTEIRKKIGRHQNRFFQKSSDSVGDIKTRFRGSGLQFKEHQVYAPGDDVRFIDWKILAKTNTPFIKTFEEERSTKIHCVVDIGRSMLMGKDGISKIQLALEFCVFLYYLAEKARDRVSVTLVGDQVKRIQAGYGEAAVKKMIQSLKAEGFYIENDSLRLEKADCPALDEELLLSEARKYAIKRRNVIVISDFLDIDNIDMILGLGNQNTHLVRVTNGFETEDEFYSMPYLQTFGGGVFNKLKKNQGFDSKLASKTKLLPISSNFIDDFKGIIKGK